jgi:flagellar hook-associated protein 1
MSSSILGNALSGLFSTRAGLTTTSHNIANANVEGYSKQRVIQESAGSQFLGRAGYLGQGTNIVGVERGFLDLVNSEINRSESKASALEASQTQLRKIDAIIADEKAGLNVAFNEFFKAAQDLSVRPADIASRTSFMGSTDSLLNRFRSTNEIFETVKAESTANIRDAVDLVNGLTKQVADLNRQIIAARSLGSNSPTPNDLLDKRDLAIRKIAEQVEVDRVKSDGGSFNLYMKNGQPLVTDFSSFDLVADFDRSDVSGVAVGTEIRKADGSRDLLRFTADGVGKGRLGGLLDAVKKVNEYQNTLGLLATRFAEEVNGAFQGGYDLNGQPLQQEFISFKDAVAGGFNGKSVVSNDLANSNPNVSVRIDSFASKYLAQEEFEISKGEVSPTNPSGIFVRITAGKTEGTFWQVSPAVDAGNNPIPNRFVATNPLNKDAQFTFTFFDQTGAAPDLKGADRFYVALTKGASGQIQSTLVDPLKLPLSDKAPDAISGPIGYPGNNGALVRLINLQVNKVMYVGEATGSSLSEAFNGLVSKIGTDKRDIDANLSSEQALLEQAETDRDGLAGVNTDEEAADLLKFQRAYQANSQVISTEKQLFESFLSAIGR